MHPISAQFARLHTTLLALGPALLITGCTSSAPPVLSARPASTAETTSEQVSHRIIIQFSSVVTAQNTNILRTLAAQSKANEVLYLRSLSTDTHLYQFTAPSTLSGNEVLQGLRAAPGIRMVELDQKASEQSP
ncbi:hypothetical protein [Rhodoferax sp. TS-BS-61-7]|uniref:hypothetical protein n=1 Tax=Rhodoferax sp. TS-BS-61-7 TaxID=2094194 RepID=UPI0011B0C1C2|nr:hypothetical protein [Rhodoferax sp. TS-BS-61-7]